MSDIRLFIDFGSTFTKVCALDLGKEELAGWAKAPSTVDSDVTDGLREALRLLSGQTAVTDAAVRSAEGCSSAAGGLRVACLGLAPELTTKAARIAAFGAGAKVVAAYSGRLAPEDVHRLEELRPDIVLLSGGTDGGDKRTIIHNAGLLAESGDGVPVIIAAGNKSAYDEIADIFSGTCKRVSFSKNLLPALGRLDAEHINREMRDIFLSRITASRGLDRAEALIGRVLMPTPSAVLEAAKLLADGVEGVEGGLGELLIVDVGGATTDVYSVAEGLPASGAVGLAGLREPRVKRTVEGDLGLYHNLDALASLSGAAPDDRLTDALRRSLSIPGSGDTAKAHVELTRLAVSLAVQRHCGVLQPVYTGAGPAKIQRGKDLSSVPAVIGAGGPLVFSPDRVRALGGAVKGAEDTDLLKPVSPRLYADADYILFAAGLLSRTEPLKALHIMKKHIKPID